jgi:superfamily II DNA/RNA helicase
MSLQARGLSGMVDILVATPTRLLQHTKEGNVTLGDVAWLVLDEADTMFDQGFGKEVGEVLDALRKKPQPGRWVGGVLGL